MNGDRDDIFGHYCATPPCMASFAGDGAAQRAREHHAATGHTVRMVQLTPGPRDPVDEPPAQRNLLDRLRRRRPPR